MNYGAGYGSKKHKMTKGSMMSGAKHSTKSSTGNGGKGGARGGPNRLKPKKSR